MEARQAAPLTGDAELPIEPDIDARPLIPEGVGPTEPVQKSTGTIAWVNTSYFAEGLPLMLVLRLSTVFFTDIGVSLKSIGYLNWLGTPWNVKFLWAPLLDIVSTKRKWLVAIQFVIGLLTLGMAVVIWSLPPNGDISVHLNLIVFTLIAMAFVSATNDVAVDAFYMEGITDRRQQAAYSGYRVMAYRAAMIYVSFGLVWLATLSADKSKAWAYAFGAGGVTMILLALFHAFRLPRPELKKARPKLAEAMAAFGRAFYSYLQQERAWLMLIFIVLYKIGDEILFSMGTPFLMRYLGVSKAQLSWLAGFVGAACMVAGAMLGAWWIKKRGLKKAIWPLTILMNFNIWAYIWLAYAKPDPQTTAGIVTIAFVHGYEQIAANLGNAVLLVYLLGTCKPEFKAAHYAIGTAIMSIPSRVIGGFGGQIVESIGYLQFFILAFIVSLPSMLLLFWVPIKEEAPKPATSS
jgi:PAT family beta-lactamase induction signal transducer AmpG